MTRRFLLLALLLWAGPALAQSAALTAALDSARVVAAAADLPGLAVAVSVNGETVWSEGFGYADLLSRTPATPQTRFRVGSVAKPYTGLAVAQLVEAGRMDVDAPIQTYVPYFPEKRWPVTTRQVGAHLGGIRSYLGDEFLSNVPYPTVASGIAIFAADSLLHEPGTVYAYSSYGYNLISAAVEGASGTDFLRYMDAHVFAPLGMTRTVADWADSLYAGEASYYTRSNGETIPAATVDNSYKWAGGGFLSTVDDMVRFGHAVVLGEAVGAEGRALLFTEQTDREGEGVGYGFGWRLYEDRAGRRVVSHVGGSVGGTAMLRITPEAGLVVALATNLGGADLDWGPEIADALADAIAADALAAEPAE